MQPGLKTKKPAAGGGAAGFSKRTEQRLGGGVPLFLQTPLGGGVGRLKLEALREEMHCLDGFNILQQSRFHIAYGALQLCKKIGRAHV